MLNNDTKRRIDVARDILVGKVPDPKAQVEQITTALIYKFMDDMDNESEELGGEASFFVDGYQQYAWSKLLNPRLGGFERLSLYADAITKMPQNPHLPQLFRDIFKGAFLPYRDPQTLNLFLKEINGFTYDHSEKLGDAFEYLLSIMDAQGDAGQFRTPRHIIDLIVKIVDPKKEDTILDPACGTAGFLISAYKHILKQNSVKRPGDQLTPDDRARMMKHFAGYDISPDMVRLSLVNMYLHGFPNPKIHEYDTLTSEERWDEHYDVILANPPFMTPKGGIRPHKRFSIRANRSEVLFVDYIAEHLTIHGRAGVIVPEGVVLGTDKASLKLRKHLVEQNRLEAVISLPHSCFKPYASVATFILIFTQGGKTERTWMYQVNADGFSQDSLRTPVPENDFPDLLLQWSSRHDLTYLEREGKHGWVSADRIIAANYDLVPRLFLNLNSIWHNYKVKTVKELCTLEKGTLSAQNANPGIYPLVTTAEELKTSETYQFDSEAVCVPLVSSTGHGHASIKRLTYMSGKFSAATIVCVLQVRDSTIILPRFLYYFLETFKDDLLVPLMKGAANVSLSLEKIGSVQIPIPPLDEQKSLISGLEKIEDQISELKEFIQSLNKEKANAITEFIKAFSR